MPRPGIKLTTFWCTGRCSNQLNHRPGLKLLVFNLNVSVWGPRRVGDMAWEHRAAVTAGDCLGTIRLLWMRERERERKGTPGRQLVRKLQEAEAQALGQPGGSGCLCISVGWTSEFHGYPTSFPSLLAENPSLTSAPLGSDLSWCLHGAHGAQGSVPNT